MERYYEERWGYLALPALFILFSRGLVMIEQFLKKNIKSASQILSAVLIIFLLIGAYVHFKTLNTTLITKKDTYVQVRDAGIWIKENSEKGDVIFSNSLPQISSYSERLTYGIDQNQSVFLQELSEKNAKYLVLTMFEYLPPWTNSWLDNNSRREPVQAFLIDYHGQ